MTTLNPYVRASKKGQLRAELQRQARDAKVKRGRGGGAPGGGGNQGGGNNNAGGGPGGIRRP